MKLSNVAISKLEHQIIDSIMQGNDVALRWILESLNELGGKVMWAVTKDKQQVVIIMYKDDTLITDDVLSYNEIKLEDGKILGAGSVLLGFEFAARNDRPSIESKS